MCLCVCVYTYLRHNNISIRHFCFIPTDHFELDAQISAPDTSGQVEGHGDRLGR